MFERHRDRKIWAMYAREMPLEEIEELHVKEPDPPVRFDMNNIVTPPIQSISAPDDETAQLIKYLTDGTLPDVIPDGIILSERTPPPNLLLHVDKNAWNAILRWMRKGKTLPTEAIESQNIHTYGRQRKRGNYAIETIIFENKEE